MQRRARLAVAGLATATGTGGPSESQFDIFNLAGGPSVIAAARAFGEEPPNGDVAFPSQPPNAAPGGFILPWQASETGRLARRRQRRGRDRAGSLSRRDLDVQFRQQRRGRTAAQLVNGLIELDLSQWTDNRATNSPGH
jgi:hypothetical protein